MTKILTGNRIGKAGKIRLGCSAVIFSGDRQKILLTRRTDNGAWCLPSGGMDPGESLSETCVREVWEETGLRVRVTRLIGIYSSPDRLIVYPDGNRFQMAAINFEAEIEFGEIKVTEETTGFGYFSPAEIEIMDVMENHRERIADAFSNRREAYIR